MFTPSPGDWGRLKLRSLLSFISCTIEGSQQSIWTAWARFVQSKRARASHLSMVHRKAMQMAVLRSWRRRCVATLTFKRRVVKSALALRIQKWRAVALESAAIMERHAAVFDSAQDTKRVMLVFHQLSMPVHRNPYSGTRNP